MVRHPTSPGALRLAQVGAELTVGDMDDLEAPTLPCAVRTEQVQASRSPPSATPSRRRDEEDRVFRRDFFASDKADHAAILEYASGKWWSRR